MEDTKMSKLMMAVVFTAACGTPMMPPNGNNNGSGSGSGSGGGSEMGSDMGSDKGSDMGSGGPLGTACTSASDCSSGACDLTQHLCVAPAFAFDPTGFVDDGVRWWTNKPSPTHHGTIRNGAGQTLTAYINTTAVGLATLTGTTWSL